MTMHTKERNTEMRFVKKGLAAGCGLVLAATVASTAFAAKPEYKGPVKAEEFHVRDGIGHMMKKIRAGKPITVAYLGGDLVD